MTCENIRRSFRFQAGDATRRIPRPRKQAAPPTAEAYERTYADSHRALEAINFFRTRNPELVMRSVRSLLYRAEPDGREVDLARAVAIEVLRTVERVERSGYERGLADAGDSAPAPPRAADAASSHGSLAPRPPRR